MQKFLRVIEPLFEFGSQRLCRKLRSHGDLARGRIGGNELHFINTDRGIFVVAKRFLDLLREVLRFGSPHGKGLGQAGRVLDRDLVRK